MNWCQVFNSGPIINFQFTYDGWNLVGEVADDQTTVVANVYAWGLGLSGSLQGTGGLGGLLLQTIITPTTASSYFPLADANGNILFITPLTQPGINHTRCLCYLLLKFFKKNRGSTKE